VGIINDVFDKITSKYFHHFKTINCKNKNEVIEGLELVMIELPKFTPKSMVEKRMAVLWLRFLKEIKEKTYIEPAPELMANKYIRKAIEICEEGAYSDAEKQAYEKYWDIIRTESAVREVDKAEGIEIGKAEGIEIGKTEGIEIGKTKAKENIVVKSFKNGASIDFISSITELSNNEVISILKQHELM
jgi:predicted transposase/invertase (TIGR01784 family)